MQLPPSRADGAAVTCFAAYAGPSMNPTLREPEILEIRPYGSRRPRVGDVALFASPETGQRVVHRVVRLTSAGIATRGDNNTQVDRCLLPPHCIEGQVVAAWRGQRRRRIAGGMLGRLAGRWLRWRRVLDRGVAPLLRPLYRGLARGRVCARVLPAAFRPRVVVFQAGGCRQIRLLLGRRIIGRYDEQRQRWQIQRPFQLLVDGETLSRRQQEPTGTACAD